MYTQRIRSSFLNASIYSAVCVRFGAWIDEAIGNGFALTSDDDDYDVLKRNERYALYARTPHSQRIIALFALRDYTATTLLNLLYRHYIIG